MAPADGSMEGLAVDGCTRCPALVDSRSRIVNGVGPTEAKLVLVGEAPGEQEDHTGEPFVGRSGSVLSEALDAAGIDREDIRITNAVRCRPPENRNPRVEELDSCRDWLEAELYEIDPEVILAVGKVPASHLLGRDVAVTAEAGAVDRIAIRDRRYPVVICVHPAAVLYDRSQEERLENAIATAARELGVTADDRQQRLGDF